MDEQTIEILLVEDDETDAFLLETELEEVRFPPMHVTHAGRLSQALEMLGERHFDIVLSDLGLPDSRGLETFCALFKAHPAIPILVLTGSDDQKMALSAIQAGAQDYLVKGRADGDALARVIRYAIERRKAADILQISELRYRRLFEAARDGILILDALTRKITEANPYLTELLGYSREEFIGRELWEIGLLQDEQASMTAFRELQDNGYIRYDDLPLKTKNGQIASVEFISNVYGEDGHSVIQCSIRDISERKRAETALLEREQEQRRLAETLEKKSARLAEAQAMAKLASWELDFSTGVLAWSDENFRIFDIEPEKFGATYEAFLARIHPDDRAAVHSAYTESVDRHTPYEIDHRMIMKDGSLKIVHERCQTFYDATGRPIRSLGTTQDITERKLIEEKIRFQAHLMEAVGQAIIATDLDGTITYWNHFAQTLYGWTAQEVEGRSILEVTPPHHSQQQAGEIMERIAAGENWSGEFMVQRRDGTVFPAMVSNTPIYDAAGKVAGVIGVSSDITERKRAEQELQDSRARFQNIVANVPGMVYQFTMELDGAINFSFVSEGCRELVEMEPEQIRLDASSCIDLIEDAYRSAFDSSVAQSAAMLTPWSWEGRIRVPSGKLKWVQGASRPRRLSGGGTLWDGLLMDITARKEAEEERDRFFTLSLDMLAIIGSDGYMKRLNPAFEATLGFSSAEMMAVPFIEFVHPDDHAITRERVAQLESGLNVMDFENRYRCHDGSYKWLCWTCAPFEDIWYCVAHDVTGVKQTAAALHKANNELELHVMERTAELEISNRELRHNEARLLQGNTIFTDLTRLRVTTQDELKAAISKITEAGIVLLDIDRCSVWVYNDNQTALRCFDLYENSSGCHTQGAELSVEDYPAYFQALATRRAIIADEAHTHPATHEFSQGYLEPLGIVSMLDAPIVIGGDMVGVVCCEKIGEVRHWQVEDQTFAASIASICSLALESHDRTRAEGALRQAKEEADESRGEADAANLAKSEFLSRMSHELRTPLNAILGFGQILSKDELTPLQKESVGYIVTAGRHLLGLINEVLDIARVEAGRSDFSIEPVALSDVVPDACAMMLPLATERGIRLDHALLPQKHAHVLADRQRLKQVLINLISNAIKYNRPGGEVMVSCETMPDEQIRIAVRDTGPGISVDDLPKLFTPFERLDAASSDVEGTGLGLVLSQRLIAMLGGTMEVESVVGQGSVFSLYLPAATAPEETLVASPEDDFGTSGAQPGARPFRVLCIEDNSSNLRLMEIILEARPEVTMMSAMAGGAGLNLARQHEPDLILLDLHLPDMPGSDVLERLQRSGLTRDIPVIVISADATPPQIQRLMDGGAMTYLTKPLNIAEFLRVLDQIFQARTDAGPE